MFSDNNDDDDEGDEEEVKMLAKKDVIRSGRKVAKSDCCNFTCGQGSHANSFLVDDKFKLRFKRKKNN